MDWTALWLSVRLASTTAALLLALGIPIAYWIVYSPRRWKFLVEAIVALPLVLPPTVLGFYVLLAIGPLSPFGRAYARDWRATACRSRSKDCCSRRSCARCRSPCSRSARSSRRSIVACSRHPGRSAFRPSRRSAALSCRSRFAVIVTGVILSFAHTLGEFGVVLMVGGNLPGTTRTVSISIYDSVQSLDYHAAASTSLLLLAVSFVILACTYLRCSGPYG